MFSQKKTKKNIWDNFLLEAVKKGKYKLEKVEHYYVFLRQIAKKLNAEKFFFDAQKMLETPDQRKFIFLPSKIR